MRKLTLLIGFCLLIALNLNAERVIYGTITSNDGTALIGASVFPTNAPNLGTVTDIGGRFELVMPDSSTFFTISYIGYLSREIPLNKGNMYNIGLEEGMQLSEVVVTALGISREKKSLGYAAQEVKGEELNITRETNVISSIAGKVAGVQVISSSGAQLGGSTNIRIRGSNGLTGGSPLFVIDGTPVDNQSIATFYGGVDLGNTAADINPDDIETMTVLKGPSATALYGSRAANGVIIINTKKGKGKKGLGITVNSSISMDRVYLLPAYQNEYAGGYSGQFLDFEDPVDGQTYAGLEYYADESWGPRIDGETEYRPWWSWYSGEDYGKTIPLTAQPDNIQNFFNTGITYNNNIAISSGNDQHSVRLSFANIKQTGVIPNSENERNNVSLNASLQLNDQLSVSTNINYSNKQGSGLPDFGWGRDNVVQSFNQWFQRQIDIDQLREYRNPDGTLRSWNIRGPNNLRPQFWDSPFFTVNENFENDNRDHYFGNVGLQYQITDQLSVEGYIRTDRYNQIVKRAIATGGLHEDGYSEYTQNGVEDNFDFLAKYQTAFGDFKLDATAGGATRKSQTDWAFITTVGGLTVPNLFNLSASTDRPFLNVGGFRKEVNSLYGSANFSYKDFLYLGGTLRNDWSSALPKNNNSYLYPSISTSFVFSELWKNKWLSFGKIRAAYAQVGADTQPYSTSFSFQEGRPYGAIPTFELPDFLFNENLQPSLSSSYEFGLEMNFVNNRIGFDVAWYRENNKNQILTLPVPGSSGFSSAIINAGNIRDEGIELTLKAEIFQKEKFNWQVTLNAAKNNSTVIALADGIDNRVIGGFPGWVSVNAPVGQEWGLIRGTGFQRLDGLPIIRTDGSYLEERDQFLGSFLPDATGGLVNALSLGNFQLTAFVDFQIGGKFFSNTKALNSFSGLAVETAGLNDKGNPIRDPVETGGGVKVEGVLIDGTPHEVYVEAQTHFRGLNNIAEAYIYDATYFKLRELSIGYQFPSKWVKTTPFQQLILSLNVRNLWLIHSNVDGIDPSEISPGSNPFQFIEGAILPGVRTVGFNLKAGF